MVITDAGNTYNYALHLIKQLDYVPFLDDIAGIQAYGAVNQNIKIYASDPVALLGLAYIVNQNIIETGRFSTMHLDAYSEKSIHMLGSMDFRLEILFNEQWHNYLAKKNDITVIASSPLGILGLVTIISEFSSDWQGANLPPHLDELLE